MPSPDQGSRLHCPHWTDGHIHTELQQLFQYGLKLDFGWAARAFDEKGLVLTTHHEQREWTDGIRHIGIRSAKRYEPFLTSGTQGKSAAAFQRWESPMKDRMSIGDCDPGLSAEIVVVRSSHPNRPLIRPSYYRIKCYRIAASALRRKPECSQDSGPACASQARLNGVQHERSAIGYGAR